MPITRNPRAETQVLGLVCCTTLMTTHSVPCTHSNIVLQLYSRNLTRSSSIIRSQLKWRVLLPSLQRTAASCHALQQPRRPQKPRETSGRVIPLFSQRPRRSQKAKEKRGRIFPLFSSNKREFLTCEMWVPLPPCARTKKPSQDPKLRSLFHI
jgi:hypothetical protein